MLRESRLASQPTATRCHSPPSETPEVGGKAFSRESLRVHSVFPLASSPWSRHRRWAFTHSSLRFHFSTCSPRALSCAFRCLGESSSHRARSKATAFSRTRSRLSGPGGGGRTSRRPPPRHPHCAPCAGKPPPPARRQRPEPFGTGPPPGLLAFWSAPTLAGVVGSPTPTEGLFLIDDGTFLRVRFTGISATTEAGRLAYAVDRLEGLLQRGVLRDHSVAEVADALARGMAAQTAHRRTRLVGAQAHVERLRSLRVLLGR